MTSNAEFDGSLTPDSVIQTEETGVENYLFLEPLGSVLETVEDRSRWEKVKAWTGRHKTRLALGMAAVSAVATLTNNPFSDLKEDVTEAAPWVAGGVVMSEVLFIGGAAMMTASIGNKIGNPLTIKQRIPEIAARAEASQLFRTGFWVNTVGAVGDFAVISAGIVGKMPVESYGMLAITLADLGVTVTVRKAILNGIHKNLVNTETKTETL